MKKGSAPAVVPGQKMLFRRLWPGLCNSILWMNVLWLAGCGTPSSRQNTITSRPFELENGYAVLPDAPGCRFKWIAWAHTNTRNPLLLTRDTLNHSMIGIMRLRAGATLPRGTTPVRSKMSSKEIEDLLRENLKNRPNSTIDESSINATTTRICNHDAVRLAYQSADIVRHKWIECAFENGPWLYYFLFSDFQDAQYAEDLRDFETVLTTFEIVN